MKKQHFLTAILFMCFGCFAAFSAEEAAADTIALTLGEPAAADITSGGEEALFSFVPEETYFYTFYSISDKDTYGTLLDENMSEITHDDDGGDGNNFKITYSLDAGTTYYLAARYWGSDETGSFTICAEQSVGLLSVSRVGNDTLTVEPGGSAGMEVSAVCTSEEVELSYRWEHSWYDEQGNWQREVVENATGPSYLAENISGPEDYYCYVTDEYGNSQYVSFRIQIDNHLVVNRVGDYNISAAPGDSVTMEVNASCDAGTLHYRWSHEWGDADGNWHNETIEGADSSQYMAENISRNGYYYCYVSDDYGNSENISWYVKIDNRLVVNRVGNSPVSVEPGESAVLEVQATCTSGPLTYRWRYEQYVEGEGWYNETIEGASSPSYTLDPVRPGEYSCDVSDPYGNSSSVYFEVKVDNDLTIDAVGSTILIVSAGTDATLQVTASCKTGGLHYQWYRNGGAIDGAEGNEYTVYYEGGSDTFRCTVTDDYGGRASIAFRMIPTESVPDLAVGDAVTVHGSSQEGVKYIRLAPSETGYYRLYSTEKQNGWPVYDTGLYDENFNPLEGDYDVADYYRKVYHLIGGKTYYFGIDWYQTSDLVIHLARSNGLFAGTNYDIFYAEGTTQFTKTVGLGETAVLEVFAGCDEGEITYQWYDSQDEAVPGADTSCLTIEDVRDYAYYSCRVQDETGDFIWVPIMLHCSELSVTADTEEHLLASDGENVYMKVNVEYASEDLTYAWYYNPIIGSASGTQIEGAAEDSYGFIFDSSKTGSYTCRVSNQSGTYQERTFTVQEKQEPVPLVPDQKMDVMLSPRGAFSTYSFTPEETGIYHFDVTGTYEGVLVDVYDASWNPIQDRSKLDFVSNWESFNYFFLEEGNTYYCVTRYRELYNTGNFYLQASKIEQDSSVQIVLSVDKTNVEAGESYILHILGNYGTRVELWASEGGNPYLVKILRNYGDAMAASDSRDAAGEVTYFVRVYDGSVYAESNPVTVTVTGQQESFEAPGLNVRDTDGTVSIEVTYPEGTETGVVRLWNDSSAWTYEHTGSGIRTESETVPAGVYTIRAEAKAQGYRPGVKEIPYVVHAAQKLVLPADLDVIEEEAFAGIPAEEIVLPEGCTSIGNRAFMNCGGLKLIYMPDSVTEIAEDAFAESNVTFICESRNAAYEYAAQKKIPCIIE